MTLMKKRLFSTLTSTGWRRMASYLIALVFVLTCLLMVTLLVSLYGTAQSSHTLLRDTVIMEGDCDTTGQANLWLHLAINITAKGILGSSNFFMQVLVAPTRREVDLAHARGEWVEIGVHSLRNFRFLPRYKTLLWFLFSLSSVPLHLVFNGCILESRASNGFRALIVSDEFTNGAAWSTPSQRLLDPDLPVGPTVLKTISNIQDSILSNHSNWEALDWDRCISRYNSAENLMHNHRHVIIVGKNVDGTPITGWIMHDTKNTTGSYSGNTTTSLSESHAFLRVDSNFSPRDDSWSSDEWDGNYHMFNFISSRVNEGPYDFTWHNVISDDGVMDSPDPDEYPGSRQIRVSHCLSEEHKASCRLIISNGLLSIVCLMFSLKLILCITSLISLDKSKDNDPLTTPGDAIASFISTPDAGTRGMCTLSSCHFTDSDIQQGGESSAALSGSRVSRPWKGLKASLGGSIARSIWIISYIPIFSALAIVISMFRLALRATSIQDAHFQHHNSNGAISSEVITTTSLMGLTVIANLPQLLLSICYMSLNGLITRMMVEFEWARYSTGFRSLRVTSPSGNQRSTYRLQLPYRWSIPLLSISALLHWLYSNCLYVSNYTYNSPDTPYGNVGMGRGLQYSTVAILIALIVSLLTASVPFIISRYRLPLNTTHGGSNSKVISAACHCVPIKTTTSKPNSARASMEAMLVADNSEDIELQSNADRFDVETSNGIDSTVLHAMSLEKVKWGEVSNGREDDGVGHLAFGVEQQDVTMPVEGKLYY